MQIIKVPGINGLGKTSGCERAGNVILSCLKDEIFSNSAQKEIEFSKLDLEEIHLDNSNLEITSELVYRNSLEAFQNQEKVIFLGGDHSISYNLVKGFVSYCKSIKKEPCLIVFDAHPDLMPPVKNAEDFPTHEEWLRGLLDKKLISPPNILLVGIRNSDKEELRVIKEKKIRVITMNQLQENLEETCELIMEFADKKELYLSLDIDVVDPVFAPATGYLEPGGLTSREFLYILSRISKMKNLKGVDIVEVNEKKDTEHKTVKLSAKALAEFI
ncbi:N(1)-aminopropylagmatine ureohydrolase [uncultured archaeon]|nr:N(1)-aminopropylagmatine ureohydrolase [uncultured archaeon]